MNLSLATFEEDFWQLRSGEESHKENPEHFWIPDLEIRQNLKRGDAVKLIFDFEGYNENGELEIGGERMWVGVKEKVGDFYLEFLIISLPEWMKNFWIKARKFALKQNILLMLGFRPKNIWKNDLVKIF